MAKPDRNTLHTISRQPGVLDQLQVIDAANELDCKLSSQYATSLLQMVRRVEGAAQASRPVSPNKLTTSSALV
jgi:hypothetical protein